MLSAFLAARTSGFVLLRSVTSMAKAEQNSVVRLDEVKRFVEDCMLSVGTPKQHAVSLAQVLVAADHRGHYSHGLNRLEMYVQDVQTKICDGSATPQVLKETAATGYVDGRNGLGPVVGNFCMDLAIKKAREAGVGWVVAKGSNHYGIAGWYSMLAVQHGLLGLTFTNTSPIMSPTRSKSAALGTNPLSVAAPGADGDSFVLDMATTAVALGKIEVQRRKEEPIPVGWAQDSEGKVTTDASVAFQAAQLMPLGGAELTSGYKGYGLSAMVEIFCGISAGSAFGPHVRKWMTTSKEANLGQCFIAVDPECFAPGFKDRLSSLMDHLRNLEPADQEKPVLVAGDPERQHMDKVDQEGGVTYHRNQIKASIELAQKLGVAEMEVLKL